VQTRIISLLGPRNIMIKKLLSTIFGSKNNEVTPVAKTAANPKATPTKKKSGGYKAEVKEKYGFDLPASHTDKIFLGKKFEKEDDMEKACACYEGCVRGKFDGDGPYDRLIILYKKLDRPEDVLRIIKKAISVFEKVVEQGRSDGPKKLEKYKVRLEKLSND
jgi:hypothetical protein